ncbi:substrate binding domain-containing protein [Xenophilus azovorans]|uniref:substrate binding domain-containing protein n=1 Tax=Xenophilus azovorans TaxID=151755 RepID=UPI003CCBDF1C
MLATSSVWLETSIPIKTQSDTSSHSHPCLCELQVPTTVRAARKDGPAQAPSAQSRASRIPEAARATRAGPRLKDTRLDIGLTDRPVELIREGFDVALRAGDIADSDLNSRLLARLPMALAASPAYLAARGVPDDVAALRRHDHVRYVVGGRPYPVRFADGSVFTPEGVLDTDSSMAMRIAALNGLGIVYMLRLAIQEDLDAGRLSLVLPGHALPTVPVYALHAFGRHTPARARLFIDFVAAQLSAFGA